MNRTLAPYYLPRGTPSNAPTSLFQVGGKGTAYLTITALVVSILIHGKITDFFGLIGEDIRIGLIFFAVSLNIIGAAICAYRGMILAASLSVAALFGIFVYTFLFSINSGVPFTFSAGGEYFGYSFFGLFALTIRDQTFGRMMTWFYVCCCAYAIFYLVASLSIQIGLIDISGATRVFVGADDAGRGDRLVISSMALVFGTMAAVTNISRNFAIKHVLILAIFAIDWYMTSSRTISVLVFAVILMYVATRRVNPVGRFCLSLFIMGTVFSVFLIFFPEYNPFYLSIDTSGLTRVLSVNIAADLMRYYWVLGAGIGYGIEAFFPITGSKYFYPSDVGMIGILFSYGVLGFALYITFVYWSCTVFRPAVERGCSVATAEALVLAASTFALYSLQAPHFDSNSPASVLAIMSAALVLDKSFQRIRNRRGQGSALANYGDRSANQGVLRP